MQSRPESYADSHSASNHYYNQHNYYSFQQPRGQRHVQRTHSSQTMNGHNAQNGYAQQAQYQPNDYGTPGSGSGSGNHSGDQGGNSTSPSSVNSSMDRLQQQQQQKY